MDTATLFFDTILKAKVRMGDVSLKGLFEQDPRRLARFSSTVDGLYVDYSRHLIDDATLEQLLRMADAKGFTALRKQLLDGELINNTEQRAALHTALRAPAGNDLCVREADTQVCFERMRTIAQAIRNGTHAGYTGLPFTDIVNIGIGGSDLGPHMVTHALRPNHCRLRFHFVSNVDPAELARVFSLCAPETTLFIVSSKTFTTAETLSNARAAKSWLTAHLGEPSVARHFLAVSTAQEKAQAFGIRADHIFPIWDWVGGRYSVWSAIGLPIMLAIGPEGFDEFRAGAHSMDCHFRDAPPRENLPLIMAALAVWYRNAWQAQSHAVIAYENRLEYFTAYLQQLDMESLGKCVDRQGNTVSYDTGAVIWGGVGTNTQHSFHQLLHQGTALIPVDFLVGLRSSEDIDQQHTQLFANCIAQSAALMQGQASPEGDTQGAHRAMPGNRPHSMIVYPELTPRVLGQLIALYEHKVFCQSVLWNINPFDQYGVELGKQIGTRVAAAITAPDASWKNNSESLLEGFDPATQALIALYRKGRA